MMFVYVLLFFLLIGLFVYLAIRYLEDDSQKFADDIMAKRMKEREEMMANMYRKPKEEDITDL